MAEKSLHIRIAVPSDEGALLIMLREGHKENGRFSFDDDEVMATIRKATMRDGGVIGIIDGDGDLAASVGLILDHYWYTKDWTVTELWSFVRKPYRQSAYATDLIDFSKWFADGVGLSLGMGIMSTIRTEAKLRLYRRKLTPIGGLFAHGIERDKGPLGTKDFERRH